MERAEKNKRKNIQKTKRRAVGCEDTSDDDDEDDTVNPNICPACGDEYAEDDGEQWVGCDHVFICQLC